MTDPSPTACIGRFVERVLWYDIAGAAARNPAGSWSGGWQAPGLAVPGSRAAARERLARHPLAPAWLARFDAEPDRGPFPLDYVAAGPAPVVDVARELLAALAEGGVDAALSGSLAVFLQRPFRLSYDVDASLPDRLVGPAVERLRAALDRHGFEVTTAKASYLGGRHRRTGTTVDVEAGSAYTLPLASGAWERRVSWRGLPLLHAADVLAAKARLGRAKDRTDLVFVDSPEVAG